MTVTINGTTGITTPAISSDAGITSDGISFADGTPANTLVTTTGGNVGIGTSSPSYKLQVSGAGTAARIEVSNSSDSNRGGYLRDTGSAFEVGTNSGTRPLAFATDATERARIDTSGNLLVGATSTIDSNKVLIKGISALGLQGSSGVYTGDITFYDSSAVKKWSINTNQTNLYIADADFSHYAYASQNFTSWSFASDLRLKKDVENLEYGLATVMAIQPRRYTFLSSNKTDIGFIAQELREVVPEAVSGEEIEFDEADTPQERAAKSLGVGKETLIPILVKAIQELKAELDAAKADIATLKGQA